MSLKPSKTVVWMTFVLLLAACMMAFGFQIWAKANRIGQAEDVQGTICGVLLLAVGAVIGFWRFLVVLKDSFPDEDRNALFRNSRLFIYIAAVPIAIAVGTFLVVAAIEPHGRGGTSWITVVLLSLLFGSMESLGDMVVFGGRRCNWPVDE